MDLIDRRYHGYYSTSRNDWHLQLINKHLLHARSEPPYRAIFLAGTMGVGKGHVLRQWKANGTLSLPNYVWNDSDYFKTLIPETATLEELAPELAATLVHRESSYISELLLWETLARGASTIVEGTLKDAEWYASFFARIRTAYPHYSIEILHVDAPWDVICERVERRAKVTGRHVPLSVIRDAYDRVPVAVERLQPLVDRYFYVDNSVDEKVSSTT